MYEGRDVEDARYVADYCYAGQAINEVLTHQEVVDLFVELKEAYNGEDTFVLSITSENSTLGA
jgi:hypothetical protein